MSGMAASDSAGSDESREGEESGTGLLGKIGRWFAYYVLLWFTIHWATWSIHRHMLVDRLTSTGGLVAVVIAGVLTIRSDPPSYGRIVVFSIITIGVGSVLDAAVGPTIPTRGGLYPPVDVGLTWVAAFLFGYAVVFGVDWGGEAEHSTSREQQG